MNMYELLKKFIFLIITIAAIAMLSYGAFVLYNIVMTDATKRIKTGVSEGVTQGVGNSLNPIKMIGGVFGGGKR